MDRWRPDGGKLDKCRTATFPRIAIWARYFYGQQFVEEVADFGGGSGSWGRLWFVGEVAVHGGGSSLWGGSDS